MGQSEQDAIDIFGLLFPMLSDEQKSTKAGQKALVLSQKYRSFIRDTSNLLEYDRIVAIVTNQLKTELALDPANIAAIQASRDEAYRLVVRTLAMNHSLDGFMLIGGGIVSAPTAAVGEKPARKSPAKKVQSRPKSAARSRVGRSSRESAKAG